MARMTDRDVLEVLAKAAGYDGRRPDAAAAAAWLEAIGDLDPVDCLTAVRIHHQESTEWMKPAHVRRIVCRIRAERLANVELEAPPANPDARDYSQRLRAHIAEIASGRHIVAALGAGGGCEPTEEYRAARAEHVPAPAPEPPADWCGRCDSTTRVQYMLTGDGTGLRAVPCSVCRARPAEPAP